ncbi:Uncharacterized protein DAT39_011403 [Clarias magur]|uniref:Uncharacterized protein n=1 Tax=Clarias magur TaxID=1594786 RepID=A0A8J4U4Y9_CLAMG|nr:Uncharacterized protein DAT39_011403 [Clarias magur]
MSHFFYEGETRERQGQEPKNASDIWSVISAVFLGFLLQFPPTQSTPVFRQANSPSRARCQRSPMSIDATVLCENRASGRGGITHQVINAMGSFGGEKGGGGFDHSQPEKSFFHRSSLSLPLAVGRMNSGSRMKV